MPLKGASNLPDVQRSSAKSPAAIPHHESHGPYKHKSSKSKSSNSTPAAMPFIQQMQLLQALEGGRLEDHIRRHHKHFGETTLDEAKHRNFERDADAGLKESRGYVVTDERGMMWFDEEEEWEFKKLLPKDADGEPVIVEQKSSGLRKLFGATKKPPYVITGWETFDQSGDHGIETDDDNGGISPGVTGKVGFAYPSECTEVPDITNFHRTMTPPLQHPLVPQNSALKLPPPPQPSNTSRRKHPVLTTHTAPNLKLTYSVPSATSPTALKTMSHNQMKREFLAQAFTPSAVSSLPASRSHTPLSINSQTSLPLASRSQTSLALPSSSHSARSVSPFAILRSRKTSTSGRKQ